jgi:MinD-like ATPase involved in chromosome partitioning or flagellar assembly
VQLLAPDQIEGAVDVVVRSAATTDPVVTEPPDDPAGHGSAGGGRLLAVWGPGGAPGRTTLAVALAAETASRGRSVLLVDADPYGGTVAQHLGVLDEVSGLLAAARLANAGGLDEQRLRSCARGVGDGLSVLSGLPRADRWPEVRPAAFADLLGQARSLADVVVVDCGFSLERGPADGGLDGPGPSRNLMTLAAVLDADEVLVVGSADPVGLARLARGLVDLHEVVPDVRPRVVVNRCRPTLGFGEEEVRGMVAGFVNPSGVHFVPDDQAAADRALMAGRSLVETGESGLRKAVARLADDATGVRPQRRRRFRRSRPAQAPNSR